MKLYKNILFVIAISLNFLGCKKYPDDGVLIEYRTVHNRLLGGYNVETYLINGIDSTINVPYSGFNLGHPYQISFVDETDNPHTIIGDINGHYYFPLGKKSIQLDVQPYTSKGVYFNIFQTPNGHSIFWEIRKLTKNQFWLKADYNFKTYEIHLKKV